jgi:hypothetical protein
MQSIQNLKKERKISEREKHCFDSYGKNFKKFTNKEQQIKQRNKLKNQK